MHCVVNGLVLRSVDYRESDKILTVLTDRMGLLTVSARGARRRKSPLLPAVQLFCYSEMTLFEYGGRLRLDEAEPREQFSGLSRNLDEAALAAYLAEVLATEAEGVPLQPDVLRLALNSLYALSRGLSERWKIKAAFELRYAALSGYMPDAKTLESALDAQALRCAQYILGCEVRRILAFSLEGQSREKLCTFCEKYLLSRWERSFKTLDFYRSLGELL